MRVVVVGGGVISKKLIACAPSDSQVKCFKIRNIENRSSSWNFLLEECAKADLIVYLAYHHRSLRINLTLLLKILSALKKNYWQGKIIFFNTQSTLSADVLKTPKELKEIFRFDLYTFTKRLQSWFLSRYSRFLNISEIYLPVVLGEDTKANKTYKSISKYNYIHLPQMGKNNFAYIYVDVFLSWFWNLSLKELIKVGIKQKYLKIFVYQGISTFGQMLIKFKNKYDTTSKTLVNKNTSMVFKDCKYKYRFSNDLITNFIYGLKLTPIWLMLSFLQYELRKLISFRFNNSRELRNHIPNKISYVPTGPEYQYFCSSIILSKIKFKIVKVKF